MMGQRIRATLPLFSFLVVVSLAGSVVTAAPAQNVWHKDFATAEALAKRLNRPLLIHFHASWCGPCRKMEAEVLHTPDLQRFVSEKMVAVKVDVDAHPELSRHFRVEALPHDIILTPDGKYLGGMEGFQPRQTYLATLSRSEDRFAKAEQSRRNSSIADAGEARKPVSAPRPKAHSVTTDESGMPVTTPSVRINSVEPVVGLDGYCPVTLYSSRGWTRGDPAHSAEYQGMTYYFASAANAAEFQRAPNRYAPRLLGCDPVVLWDTERAMSGSTQFAAFYDGELYLFENAESRRRFRANPARYIRTRQVKLENVQRR